MTLTNRDRMLPTQPIYTEQFNGDEESLYDALYALMVNSSRLEATDNEFSLVHTPMFTLEEMASSPTLLRFLQVLIYLKRPRSILEIGAFIGVSTMAMATALDEGCQVVSIEKYDHFAGICRQNFSKNRLEDKIRLIEGDAFIEIPKLAEKFDMVFLDGNKERYHKFFPLIDDVLSPGGLLVMDDAFFHGDSLNEHPNTPKGMGVRKFLEAAGQNDNYAKSLLPFGNGVMLMIKQGR